MDQAQIDSLRAQTVRPGQLLIDGKSRDAADGAVLDVISPIDGQSFTTIADANAADVDAAVAAARRAFDAGVWSKMAPAGRKKILQKWAELIEAHALELAVLGVRDNGTEINMAIKAEPGSAAGTIRYYAEALDKIYGEIAPTAPDVLGMIHKEPVGVVGAIVPWNFPLMIGAWKMAPALAMGNSVVLKPAETASLSLIRTAQLALEAGLPEGVLNVVTGQGAVAGQALARSMDVDVLTFTGSGGVGRMLMEYAAQSNLKRVYLELGGKSPNVVFADTTDIEETAAGVVGGIFRDSGQICIAGSHLLVEDRIHDDFVALCVEKAKAIKVGDPLKLDTHVGALNSEEHMNRVLGFLHGTQNVQCGGARVLEETGGFYVPPTIVTDVKMRDRIAAEEIFGPVMTVTKFKDEAEAVALANDNKLGLAAGVWTSNLSRAHRMIGALQAGVVHVNTYGGADNTVPLGGHKESGNGQDKSLHAIEKFINKKTAWIKL